MLDLNVDLELDLAGCICICICIHICIFVCNCICICIYICICIWGWISGIICGIWDHLAACGILGKRLAASGIIWQHQAQSGFPHRAIRALEPINEEKILLVIQLSTKYASDAKKDLRNWLTQSVSSREVWCRGKLSVHVTKCFEG